MFQPLGGQPGDFLHLDRIERWTRSRFSLADEHIVVVSVDASGIPGFPEKDTTVRFWTDRTTRYRFRIFKPASEVVEADLPEHWLMPGLIDDGDPDCC
ncbi:MAG TPA: hypothetical protein VK862_02060 [Afifellaceae bacterium]|nr:hypothetical protein [Afifellaceae bacterium]